MSFQQIEGAPPQEDDGERPDYDSWCTWDDSCEGGQLTAAGGIAEEPAKPASCEPALTEAEKLDYLRAEFPSASQAERQTALDSSYGNLSDAMQLLRSFAEEDAAAQAVPPCQEICNDFGSLALEPNAADPAQATPSGQVLAQISCLAACFPGIKEENVLECAAFDLAEAQSTLRDQGYTEVAYSSAMEEEQPAQQAPAPAAFAVEMPPQQLSAPSSGTSIEEITAGMPPREREAFRNQLIYEQERGAALRLKTAYQQLRTQAERAAEHGERRLAADLTRRANELREEYERKNEQAAGRILRRVNEGKRSFSEVDLHGTHVGQALQVVETALQQAPAMFPGGMTVRYITGRGSHSENGAQLKPAVVELLLRRGAKFREGPGFVDVVIQGADA